MFSGHAQADEPLWLSAEDLANLPIPDSAERYSLCNLLLRARTVKGGLKKALAHLARAGGWDLGLAWLAHNGQLRFVGSWQSDGVVADEFIGLSRVDPFKSAISLPRLVLERRAACRVSDIRQGARLLRYEAARKAGFQQALVWPLLNETGLYGVIELYATRSVGPNDLELGLLHAHCHDIAVFLEARRFDERLRTQHAQLALRDGLTGLPNRNLFIERGNQALLRAERHDEGVSVLLIEFGTLTPVNCQYDYDVGDALLIEVGQRLTLAVRSSDTVARLGGDEFVVLLPELSDTQGLTVVAQKIIDALDEPFLIEGVQVNVSTNVGIARYPNDGVDIDTLLCAANESLYHVKKPRRQGVCFYSD